MLAVGLSAEQVSKRYLCTPERPWSHSRVIVACHNSPKAVTLSGDAEAIESLIPVLNDDNVFNRVVKTGGKAYHSHHTQQAATEYEELLQSSAFSSASRYHGGILQKVPMFSTVKTARIDHDLIPDSYWVTNLNSPVLFEQGVNLMLSEMPDINTLIEIGPHPALAGPLRQILQSANKVRDVVYLSTLKRAEHDGEQMLKLAGRLWAKNGTIDLKAVVAYADECSADANNVEIVKTRTGSLLVDLPPYHWTYSTPCWFEPRLSKEQRQMQEPRHDILGRRVIEAATIEPTWRNVSHLPMLLRVFPKTQMYLWCKTKIMGSFALLFQDDS